MPEKKEYINIPASLKAAGERLDAIGKLVTASEWERAAIVAAFVDLPGSGGDHRSGTKVRSDLCSAAEFAALGFHGLRSKNTVALYASAWLDRFPRPRPGQRTVRPTEEWPPTRTGTDGYESTGGMEKTIERMVDKHGADAVGRAIAQNPKVTESVVRAGYVRPVDPPFTHPPVIDQGIDDFVTLSGMLGRISGGLDIAAVWVRDHPSVLGEDGKRKIQEFWLPQIRRKFDLLSMMVEGDQLTDEDLAQLLGSDPQ